MSWLIPSYFAPSYWAGEAEAMIFNAEVPPSGDSDRDGFAAIGALINSTGLFAAVLVGRLPPNRATDGALLPRAWVRPLKWVEKSDADPETKVRTVTYTVTLYADGANTADPERDLDQLACAVQDVVGANDLGFCMPHLCQIDSASYPANDVAPQLSVTLIGSFAYLISGDDTRDFGTDVIPAV